ncbi:hypothetical protein N9D31_01345 [Oligoflexaceae bacterium]|nr:hypothetical protein [Oligoflexaceae bacterium]
MKYFDFLMSKARTLTVLVLLSLCSSACGDERSNKGDKKNVSNDFGSNYIYDKDFVSSVTQSARERVQQDQCFKNSDSPEEDCAADYKEVSFRDGSFQMKASTGEPVLMTEYDVDVFLATTRYRHRYKNLYTVKDGRIVDANPRVRLPTVMFETMSEIAGHDFVPAHAFKQLGEIFDDAYPDVSGPYSNHNTVIQEILMEYNPETPIVGLSDFGKFESLFDKSVVCGRGSLRKKKKHIKSRSQAFAQDLKALIRRERISYVNMSFGISNKSVVSDLEELCGSRRQYASESVAEAILDSFKSTFEYLNQSDGVLSVQAAPYNSWDDGPYDCSAEYSMRIIAGAYNQKASSSAWGFSQRSDSNVPKVGRCGDAYVNFNTDFESNEDKPQTLMATLGIGFGMGRIGRKSSVSTSNATPLVLSHVIYLRHSPEFANREIDSSLTEDLLKELKICEEGDRSSCEYSDPLKLRKLRVYELKYW